MKRVYIGIISLLLFSGSVFGQWQIDEKYGCRINVPEQWTKDSWKDGTDKVYDFYSPDEAAGVQLRAFRVNNKVSIDEIIQSYEQYILPSGSRREEMKGHTSQNGIPGKQAVYLVNMEGLEVATSAFFTIQNGNGYVLSAFIVKSMLRLKSEEVKTITQSFMIDGFQSQPIAQTPSVSKCPRMKNPLVYAGKTYATVQIGNQCWMAENLNVGQQVYKDDMQSDNGIIEKYCLNDKPENCEKYGGLYQWQEIMEHKLRYDEALGAQGICPPGWHIPTDDEWNTMEGHVDSEFGVGDKEWGKEEYRGSDVGHKLKSTTGWVDYGEQGANTVGFNALPAGLKNDFGSRPYGREGMDAFFWTSRDHSTFAWVHYMNYSNKKSFRYLYRQVAAVSLRCIKD